jgi:hypothetical protein
MNPATTIPQFDTYLAHKGLCLEAITLGGAALNLLGVIKRDTQDCDIIHPDLPGNVLEAAKAFAAQMRAKGEVLNDGWLNNGPSSLAKVLPEGWRSRVEPLFKGKALTLAVLGRPDLLKSKLFALVDRGTDIADCIAMKPTLQELDDALPWVQSQDANEKWPAYAARVIEDLKKRLGHV